jgi:hypothetical protein
MRVRNASAYTNLGLFQKVIVPADGATAAAVQNGDLGTSPFFEQLSDKPKLASTCYVARRMQSARAGQEIRRRSRRSPAICCDEDLGKCICPFRPIGHAADPNQHHFTAQPRAKGEFCRSVSPGARALARSHLPIGSQGSEAAKVAGVFVSNRESNMRKGE